MRSVKHSLALASLGVLIASASCTLITDVDRSKIQSNTDAGLPPAGEAGANNSSSAGNGNVENTAGAGDSAGAPDTSGTAGGAAGAAGAAGAP